MSNGSGLPLAIPTYLQGGLLWFSYRQCRHRHAGGPRVHQNGLTVDIGAAARTREQGGEENGTRDALVCTIVVF